MIKIGALVLIKANYPFIDELFAGKYGIVLGHTTYSHYRNIRIEYILLLGDRFAYFMNDEIEEIKT